MSENTHASEIDRLIHSSKDVIAAARRPDGLELEVPVSSAVKVTEGRAGAPEVRIETAWERVVPAAELGTAVTAAITSFLRERQAVVEPEEELPAWHPDTTSGQNLNAAMERINAALDASFAKLGEAQGQLTGERRATLADERGRVRAQAHGGNVTSVEIDPARTSRPSACPRHRAGGRAREGVRLRVSSRCASSPAGLAGTRPG